jgi:hypothetical protein
LSKISTRGKTNKTQLKQEKHRENPQMGFAECGNGKLKFDITRTLDSEADCSRYLTLKCERNEEKFKKFPFIVLELIINAAAGSKVYNVWRLKEGCLGIKTKDLEQAKRLKKLANIAGLFEITVEEYERKKQKKNESTGFRDEKLLTIKTSRRQAWDIKMKQSRRITTWTTIRTINRWKKTSDIRWQNHRYKPIFKRFKLNIKTI